MGPIQEHIGQEGMTYGSTDQDRFHCDMATYPPQNGFANEHLHSHILAATHITAGSKAIQKEAKTMFNEPESPVNSYPD
jgi:hypothetical protein